MRLTRIIRMMFLSLMTLALLSVGVASAAPANSPNVEHFEFTCDNG